MKNDVEDIIAENFLSEENVIQEENLEIATLMVDSTSVSQCDAKKGIGKVIDVEKYSSLLKLLRVVSYCLRFRNVLVNKSTVNSIEVTSEETENALKELIKWDQLNIVDDKKK